MFAIKALFCALLLLPGLALADASAETPLLFNSGPVHAPSSLRVHPNYQPGKCLEVRGAVFANGTPVQIYDCNGSAAQAWILSTWSPTVRLAGTNFCLDAGDPPFLNGAQMKIWDCYDIPAQRWTKTVETIQLQGTTMCLDLTDGHLDNATPIQVWECNGGPNQRWSTSL